MTKLKQEQSTRILLGSRFHKKEEINKKEYISHVAAWNYDYDWQLRCNCVAALRHRFWCRYLTGYWPLPLRIRATPFWHINQTIKFSVCPHSHKCTMQHDFAAWHEHAKNPYIYLDICIWVLVRHRRDAPLSGVSVCATWQHSNTIWTTSA